MVTLLRMPEVAANATEAVLQEWLVPAEGRFDSGTAIATVETEKALVEVAADGPGVLLRALVEGGTQVEVGAPIAVLGGLDERIDDLDAVLTQLGVAAADGGVRPERRTVPDDPEGGTANTDRPELPDIPVESSASGPGPGEERRIFASPLARRLAAEAGIPLEAVTGTGPKGRVLRRDVDGAVAARRAAGPPARPTASTVAYREVPHTRMRRAIGARLTQSKQEVPHFYVRATVRVDKLVKLRERVNTAPDTRVSVNDLVVKAVARAHRLVPEANVIWTPEAMRELSDVDVAVAVTTETGLLTPVVRRVDTLPLSAVSAAVRDLATRARSGKLRQDELEGGSITVTNLGMFGTEEFAAIINPPQSAILAVGATRQEPVVGKRGRLTAATTMKLTLSVDHRAVDGALAARWMSALVSVVEDPLQILV